MCQLNSAERQAVWDVRIAAHTNSCAVCQEDASECPEWVHLIRAYNSAESIDIDGREDTY